MTEKREETGEYATLDGLAGYAPPQYQSGAIGIANLIREALLDETNLESADAKVVGTLVSLRPGQAVMTTVMDVEGVEYEVYVRQAD